MEYKKIREAIENPPTGCLLVCSFYKQTHVSAWGSRCKCKLLNRELHNHDFQDNRPEDCPFNKLKGALLHEI
jgi:hypothetical protein